MLSDSQLSRLQLIQNSLARVVIRASKSAHITPVLKSLYWLKIKKHIKCKLLSSCLRFLQRVRIARNAEHCTS